MTILNKIIENKKLELEEKKSDWEKFKKIFEQKNANLIAEIKLASPKFDYSDTIDLEEVFKFYGESKNIKAISNLIDKNFFAWDIIRWKDFKQKYNKPIFFKEFVISKTQIDWANYFGYDAILLLERCLTKKELIEFSEYAIQKNIFPIIEIDTEIGLEKVLNLNLNYWIAVNCRNLWNMEIDRKKHFSIIKNFEKKLENILLFAFSWIDNLEQVKEYEWIYNGVLVGSYFMERFKK
jgi:indole-3-glycerol phosphate synthase